MQRKALALLSGGLDSTLAVKVMLDQGIAVEALNFTSPFCTCTGRNSGCKSEAVRVAKEFGIPIKVLHKGVDYLEVIRNPKHGRGKGMNPCVDCRIFLLRKAAEYMAECGADFVITGEVLGQRPMSQRRDTLRVIERESGLEGLLLRPLSAKHFSPTIPEREGWVQRDKLLAIQGRSRKEQMQLADDLDVKDYPCPAGGCLLTELSFVSKVRDVFDHADDLNLRDFRLLKLGRHFRVGSRAKVIIGRDEAENDLLIQQAQPGEATIRWPGGSSPTGLMTGAVSDEELEKAAKILFRYTKAEPASPAPLLVTVDGVETVVTFTNDITPEGIEAYRV
jgi:tRNA U34 2-thiouridine synthase MnmA/TrmU